MRRTRRLVLTNVIFKYWCLIDSNSGARGFNRIITDKLFFHEWELYVMSKKKLFSQMTRHFNYFSFFLAIVNGKSCCNFWNPIHIWQVDSYHLYISVFFNYYDSTEFLRLTWIELASLKICWLSYDPKLTTNVELFINE